MAILYSYPSSNVMYYKGTSLYVQWVAQNNTEITEIKIYCPINQYRHD